MVNFHRTINNIRVKRFKQARRGRYLRSTLIVGDRGIFSRKLVDEYGIRNGVFERVDRERGEGF